MKEYSSTRFIKQNNYTFCGYNLKIARILGANLGVSAYVWDSGIALCKYFEKEKISFTGKKVIELGAGTGIVGILAALLGGNVTITDKPKSLMQIRNNVYINIPPVCRNRLKVRPLVWGEDDANFPTDYDFILGSDIVYQSDAYPDLVDTLLHLSSEHTTIYLATEFRTDNGSLAFHEVLLTEYFNCGIVDTSKDKDIAVYKISKTATSR
ncbi:EEF1A lysine methyltransferase 3-like [Heterodontus francisci]|uniref:EEF1A lysine methyltransferase 3-like n=1 Tax=Heterodontus francisci TaxID=7792 RepID=UPI00355B669B